MQRAVVILAVLTHILGSFFIMFLIMHGELINFDIDPLKSYQTARCRLSDKTVPYALRR